MDQLAAAIATGSKRQRGRPKKEKDKDTGDEDTAKTEKEKNLEELRQQLTDVDLEEIQEMKAMLLEKKKQKEMEKQKQEAIEKEKEKKRQEEMLLEEEKQKELEKKLQEASEKEKQTQEQQSQSEKSVNFDMTDSVRERRYRTRSKTSKAKSDPASSGPASSTSADRPTLRVKVSFEDDKAVYTTEDGKKIHFKDLDFENNDIIINDIEKKTIPILARKRGNPRNKEQTFCEFVNFALDCIQSGNQNLKQVIHALNRILNEDEDEDKDTDKSNVQQPTKQVLKIDPQDQEAFKDFFKNNIVNADYNTAKDKLSRWFDEQIKKQTQSKMRNPMDTAVEKFEKFLFQRNYPNMRYFADFLNHTKNGHAKEDCKVPVDSPEKGSPYCGEGMSKMENIFKEAYLSDKKSYKELLNIFDKEVLTKNFELYQFEGDAINADTECDLVFDELMTGLSKKYFQRPDQLFELYKEASYVRYNSNDPLLHDNRNRDIHIVYKSELDGEPLYTDKYGGLVMNVDDDEHTKYLIVKKTYSEEMLKIFRDEVMNYRSAYNMASDYYDEDETMTDLTTKARDSEIRNIVDDETMTDLTTKARDSEFRNLVHMSKDMLENDKSSLIPVLERVNDFVCSEVTNTEGMAFARYYAVNCDALTEQERERFRGLCMNFFADAKQTYDGVKVPFMQLFHDIADKQSVMQKEDHAALNERAVLNIYNDSIQATYDKEGMTNAVDFLKHSNATHDIKDCPMLIEPQNYCGEGIIKLSDDFNDSLTRQFKKYSQYLNLARDHPTVKNRYDAWEKMSKIISKEYFKDENQLSQWSLKFKAVYEAAG